MLQLAKPGLAKFQNLLIAWLIVEHLDLKLHEGAIGESWIS